MDLLIRLGGLSLSRSPFGVVVNQDGTRLYVGAAAMNPLGFPQNQVLVIDTATNTIAATVPLPSGQSPVIFVGSRPAWP